MCSCPLFFLSVRYFRSGRERNPCRVQIYTHPACFCMSWEVSSCVAKRSEATEFTLSFIEPFPSAMCLVLSGRSGVIFVAQPLLPRACCCATCLVAPRLTVDELDCASSLRREGPGPIDIHAALTRRCAGEGLAAPCLSRFHQALEGITYKRGQKEIRGRKPKFGLRRACPPLGRARPPPGRARPPPGRVHPPPGRPRPPPGRPLGSFPVTN